MKWPLPIIIKGFALLRVALAAVSVGGGFSSTIRTAYRVFRVEGWDGVRQRLKLVENLVTQRPAPPEPKQQTREYEAKRPEIRPRSHPTISVIIPIYDRTVILRSAIESILRQTFQDFELILVLDGSPQETRDVVARFSNNPKVRIFSYPNPSGNAVRPRNKGIRESRGRYVAFLDSDDIADEDRLRVSLEALESGSCDVIYGAWQAMIDGSRPVEGLRDGQIVYSPQCNADMLSKVCVPVQSTVMLKRSIFEVVGYLKTSMQYREDHELWARIAYFGYRFLALPSILVRLRLHSGNNELNFKSDDDFWLQKFEGEYKRPGPKFLKIAFILAGLGVGGGVLMIRKYAEYLQSSGHDVSFITLNNSNEDSSWWRTCNIPIYDYSTIKTNEYDLCVSTFWTTFDYLDSCNTRKKLYFVQSDERLFYKDPHNKSAVARTYAQDVHYVAVAEWLGRTLRQEFGRQDVTVVRNGIALDTFHTLPDYANLQRANRVLIEGPVTLPMKGVETAYRSVANLHVERWLVTTAGRPPSDWKIDKIFGATPHEKMCEIYNNCSILVKMSDVESFCLPALEAMACGCCVVIGQVSGGIDYLRDGWNCIQVGRGDVQGATRAVQAILRDPELRRMLQINGLQTALSHDVNKSAANFQAVIENIVNS